MVSVGRVGECFFISLYKDARKKGIHKINLKFGDIILFPFRQPKWSEDESVCARSVTNEVHCFHNADFSMYPVDKSCFFQFNSRD